MKRARPFVLIASDHGPMIVNCLDHHTLPSGGTYGVGYQILSSGAYEPAEVAEILALLNERHSPGAVALDCGANIGVHAVEMAKAMTGWGSVIAVEPQTPIFHALCGNVALANCFNVRTINAAVGRESGSMLIPQPNYAKPASFGSLELQRRPSTEYIGQSISYAARDCISVDVRTIDEICAPLARLDFIKLDVEGMELDALAGAKETIERLRPTMLVEWIKSDRPALEDFFTTRGYSLDERGPNLLARCG